jgi:hypothetical protein
MDLNILSPIPGAARQLATVSKTAGQQAAGPDDDPHKDTNVAFEFSQPS